MARFKVDPMEREIESAFLPGEFIGDRSGFAFVSGLESVAAKVGALVARTRVRPAS